MGLLRNIGHNFLAQAIVFIAGFGTIPYLTRNLGAEGFGLVAFLLLILNMLLLVDAFRPVFIAMNGLARSCGREVDYHQTAKIINRYFSIILACFLFFILNIFRAVKIDEGSGFYISLAAFFYFLASYPYANLCQGGKTGIANLVRAVGLALAYGTFVLLSMNGAALPYYAATLAAAQAMIYLSYACLDKRQNKQTPGTFSTTLFKNTLNKFINNLCFNGTVLLVSFIDRLLVHKICSIGLFGIYSVHYDLAIRGNFISSNINQALFPYLTERINTDPVGAMKIFSITLKTTVFLLLFLVTPLAAYSEAIITLYAGEDFAGYSEVLNIILAGVVVNCPGFFAVALNNARGDFKTQWVCYLTGATMMLATGYPLVYHYGLKGAALVCLVGRISDGLLFYLTVLRSRALRQTGISVMLYLLLVLPAFIYVVFWHKTALTLLLAQGYYILLFWVLCLSSDEREKIKKTRAHSVPFARAGKGNA